MKGRRLALFLCAVLLLLVGIFPQAVLENTDLDFVKSWIGKRRYEYAGELTLWHVTGTGMGMGNGANFLSARTKEFERKNFGIYFTIKVMDEKQLQERLAVGERPDLLSFPAGALSDPAGVLEELDLSGFSMDRNLKESAEKGGRSYGVPLYFGGAVLVTNDDLIYSKDLMPPSGMPDAEWIADAQEKGALSLMRIGSDTELYIAASSLCDEAAEAFLAASAGTLDEFLKGETVMAVMDVKTLYALKQREDTGHVPGVSSYGMDSMAFTTQYLGIAKDLPDEKWQVAQGLVNHVLGEKAQKRLLDYWSFPAFSGIDDFIPEDLRMASMWENQREGKPLCMPAFRKGEIAGEFARRREAGEELESLREWLRDACNDGG